MNILPQQTRTWIHKGVDVTFLLDFQSIFNDFDMASAPYLHWHGRRRTSPRSPDRPDQKGEIVTMKEDMQPPERIQPQNLGDYLDVMSKAVFGSGMSWKVIDSKWPGIREAFRGFDPAAISNYSEDDLDKLTQDKRVIRNRRKIEAIVDNANRMLELDKEHGSFRNYLRSHNDYESLVRDLRKQFRFLGNTNAYYFLWVVGEEVPMSDEGCPHGNA
jgi:3-methyladenine DNA glycosylase Tag